MGARIATVNFGEFHFFSRHSSGDFSTVPHPPIPRHIGQTVHTRGSAYTTAMPCNHLQHTDTRDQASG